MNYGAFIFIFLVGATLSYLALRLGVSIYADYSRSAQVRKQLLQRLKLLQLQPLFLSRGMDNRDILYGYPLHEAERLIRLCENCTQKELCSRKLCRGDKRFEFCALGSRLQAHEDDARGNNQ